MVNARDEAVGSAEHSDVSAGRVGDTAGGAAAVGQRLQALDRYFRARRCQHFSPRPTNKLVNFVIDQAIIERAAIRRRRGACLRP